MAAGGPATLQVLLHEPEGRRDERLEPRVSAVNEADPLDVVPTDLANLGHEVDLAQGRPRGIVVADGVGEVRVGERDVVGAGVARAGADVADAPLDAGEKAVLALFDAGLFVQLAGRAEDVGFARVEAAPPRHLPEEDAVRAGEHYEAAEGDAAVVAHEGRLELRVLLVVEVAVVEREPDAVPHLLEVEGEDVEQLLPRHVVEEGGNAAERRVGAGAPPRVTAVDELGERVGVALVGEQRLGVPRLDIAAAQDHAYRRLGWHPLPGRRRGGLIVAVGALRGACLPMPVIKRAGLG